MGNKISRRRSVIDERYTRPQGLYQHKDIDHKKLRRLIIDAKLAPCYPGVEDPTPDVDECPICFLCYPSLNRSKCCTKSICTECFLQVKSPQAARPTQCPFCKTPNYAVEYRGAKTLEEKGVERAEEQKVIEAKIRMRQKELQDEEKRMQLRDEDMREGRIPAMAAHPSRNFSNLNGFIGIESPPISENYPEGVHVLEEAVGRSSEQHTTMTPADSEFCADESSQGIFLRSTSHSVARNSDRSQVVPGQGTRFLCMNRDDGFDLDLEDIMVMEAIWRSIEDRDAQQMDPISAGRQNMINFGSNLQETNQDTAFMVNPNAVILRSATGDTREVQARQFVTGGLVGAIAALAEQQVLGVDNQLANQAHQNDEIGHTASIHGCTSSVSANDIGQSACAYSTPTRTWTRPTRGDLEGEPKSVARQEGMNEPTYMEPKSVARQEGMNEPTYMEPEEIPFHDQDSWLNVSMDTQRGFSPHLEEESQGSTS
eukprot:c28341_g1_i1 orf=264-1715(+)